ncbi:hypothetical protein THASP1DRAFT_13744 [Thamnocephalis sphaerospora]|uniref:Fe2OG dioxygenase domain-containing protein n=1 Tax=Thamnocephalis sphaerospora TaxID=78915 RepID=A0A4P9XW48_9FUNG|nr:hypothetical protein THASP1DRAFT_13744 [Thamnocephalis sphaerospora]|eukprot:RKP09821.1 hypothetical protein THASP1DRAFT_13744 [Thamnocephalis sphaerospora]
MTVLDLPVIDFGAYCDPNSTAEQRQAVDQAIDKACRHLGIFFLSNHGIPEELSDQMRACIRQFFQLPLEEKLKNDVPTSNLRGYMNASNDNTPASRPYYETLGLYPPVNCFSNGLSPQIDPTTPKAKLPTTPDALGGQNSWPSDEFQAKTEEYLRHILQLKNRVFTSIAASLGLSASSRKRFDDTVFALSLNGYQGITEADISKSGANLPEHQDPGQVDSESISLQVQDRDGEWYDVQPIADAFVVNVGVILNRWTGDQYCAPLHRVIHRSENPRISAAIFTDPSFDTSIAPLPELAPVGKKLADQKEETFGEFLLDWVGEMTESKY